MRVLAIVLALLLAGCAEPAPPGAAADEHPSKTVAAGDGSGYLVYEAESHGSVGERCTGLRAWRHPGLYDALPQAQGVEGARVYEARPAPGGIPFAHADLGAWDGSVLEQLRRDRGREGLFLWLEEGALSISGLFEPSWTDAQLRAAFDSFAENVTYADPATRAAWADTFVASKEPGLMAYTPGEGERVVEYSYSAPVEAETLALDGPWDRLGGAASANDTMHLPGTVSLQWEGNEERWSARVALAVRTLVVDTAEGPLTIDADGSGSAAAYTDGVVEAEDRDAWVSGTMVRLGLPAPDFEERGPGLAVC